MPGSASRASDLLERGSVVQRRERRELVDRALDLVVDERRADEAAAAVHDPVAHGVGRDEVVHATGFVFANEVKLEARGAGVYHQDVHRRRLS